MSRERRQTALLAVLVLLLVVIVGRNLMPLLGAGGGAAGRSASGDRAVGETGNDRFEIAELQVERLARKPATYSPGRDPFSFHVPPPPRPKPPPPDRAARRRAAAQRVQQRPPAPVPPPTPRPPEVTFVYLGSFGVPGSEIAVFSDGQEIYNAFEGDVVQEEFVVRRIGFESADIGFVNFPDSPPRRLAIGG